MKSSTILVLILLASTATAQIYSDKILHEFTLEKHNTSNTLILADLNGSIKAE